MLHSTQSSHIVKSTTTFRTSLFLPHFLDAASHLLARSCHSSLLVLFLLSRFSNEIYIECVVFVYIFFDVRIVRNTWNDSNRRKKKSDEKKYKSDETQTTASWRQPQVSNSYAVSMQREKITCQSSLDVFFVFSRFSSSSMSDIHHIKICQAHDVDEGRKWWTWRKKGK